jgi:hypothetical protein
MHYSREDITGQSLLSLLQRGIVEEVEGKRMETKEVVEDEVEARTFNALRRPFSTHRSPSLTYLILDACGSKD